MPQKIKPFPNPFDPMTSEAAWVLGIWYSDGHVDKSLQQASVTQNDRRLLDDVARIIAPNEALRKHLYFRERDKVNHKKNIMAVCSIRFVEHLTRMGVFPAKSKTKQWPEWLTDEILPHFVRGYFDGNGSITLINKQRKRPNVLVNICSGSLAFLNGLAVALEPTLGGLPAISPERDFGRIQFNSRRAVVFTEWIYQGSADGTRHRAKYDKWLQLKQQCPIFADVLA